MGMKLQAPAVHLNGTSRERLIENWEAVRTALAEAEQALRQCAPNGRDYYVLPNGPEALKRATEEHHGRLAAIRGVMDQLDSLAWAVETGKTEIEVGE